MEPEAVVEKGSRETPSGLPTAARDEKPPVPGIGLCLSGGGFRAMMFHVGALWRLNEAGLLPKLDRISSVSGGSITAAVLGMNWGELDFDPTTGVSRKFESALVGPIRRLAAHTIDVPAVVIGLCTPVTAGEEIARRYAKLLFGTRTLQDLPDRPRFVLNATNLQSGVLWRFSKPYMRDYRVGKVLKPDVPLAVAVAASAAFPPVLAPVDLHVPACKYSPHDPKDIKEDLHRQPFLSDVVLCDGGVYDNLGLETVWKKYCTVLVSDGGAKIAAKEEPSRNWFGLLKRVLDTIDNQVRSLRARQIVESYLNRTRTGTYWGIRSELASYNVPSNLDCPLEATRALAAIPTRLSSMSDQTQERLMNWGYAVCDAALRDYYLPGLAPAAQFIFPKVGVGSPP